MGANNIFLYVDAGSQGRILNGGMFKNRSLYEKLQKNALTETLMKLSSGIYLKESLQKTFNYRLSQVHRVEENVFGIATAIFRVLRKPMLRCPENADGVLTLAHLNSFLRKGSTSSPLYTPSGTFETEVVGTL